MDEAEELPRAISESVLMIGDVRLRVYNLDDGRRVINSDDVEALFASWADGGPMLTEAESTALVRLLRDPSPTGHQDGGTKDG